MVGHASNFEVFIQFNFIVLSIITVYLILFLDHALNIDFKMLWYVSVVVIRNGKCNLQLKQYIKGYLMSMCDDTLILFLNYSENRQF